MDWIYVAQNRGPVAGSCEYGNKTLGHIKGRKFFV